jgi:hypothetical protein
MPNITVEKHNTQSLTLTWAYQTAAASAAGAGTLDVGESLRALFEYSADEKELLISSKELVNAISPLPSSLTLYIDSRPSN